MNVYAYAKKMEQDGEEYYRALAKAGTNHGLSAVLNELADAEVKHRAVIEQMETASQKELGETPILQNAKNVFMTMKEGGAAFAASEIEAYEKALKIEKASEDFYRAKARELGDPGQASVFEQIAEEERKHYFLLENIIEFMNGPKQWLENAEWNHLDEY